MSLRIFLEATDIALSGYLAGHMYLVLRDVEEDANGNVTANVRTDADQTLRGSFGINLTTYNGLLTGSIDAYGPNDTPQSRHSLDITAKIMAGGDFSSVMSAWQALATDVNEISGQYLYELPTPFDSHVGNSNAVIFSALANYKVDARGIFDANGQRFVDSYFPTGMPGGNSSSATILATDHTQFISAQDLADQTFNRNVKLLGRNNISIFGGRNRVGNNKPMQQCREHVRDSTRRLTANAFGWHLARTIETTGQHDLLLTGLPPPIRFHNLNVSRTVETVYPAGYRPGRHRRQPPCARRQRTALRPPIRPRPNAAALARAVIPSCARGERS
jgi:hypothetical protein